ncbi:hypothetical protein C4580_06545 [Candidatus Woesearchaeota archaeon]|nr:MAG: hypothetical protein C4580_06545 [Candidatus Woesearchaeota archaeon]
METANRSSEGQMRAAFVPQTANHEPRAAEKQLPEKKFSTGAISATVWKNTRVGKDGKVFETRSVNLQRRYANRSGEWQSTNSLRITDLPKAALVLEEAYKYLVLSGKDEEVAQD